MVMRLSWFIALVVLAPLAAAASPTPGTVARQAQAALERATTSQGPGAVVLIAHGDTVIYRAARGSAQIELGAPLRADQTFRIASVTKMFTAAMVLKLAQLGKLSLDDTLATYVPGIANGQAITLRQLLSHTAGVSDIVDDPQPGFFARKVDTATLIAEIKKRAPMFSPGTRFSYSNAGYILLGAVIEKVTGEPWQDAVRTNLIEPQGLTNTGYGDNARIIPGRVAGYTTDNADHHVENASYINASVPAAAGALVSTADDLLHWMRALAQGRVIGRDGFEQMMTVPAGVADASAHPYGFGMYVWQVRGNKMVGHTGQIDGFASALAYVPGQDITVVVLANDDNFDARTMARRMAAIALGQPYATPVAIVPTNEQLHALEGVYRVDDATTQTLSLKDGKLYGQRSKHHAVPMMLTADQRLYFIPDELSYFTPVRDASGKVVRLDYFEGGDGPALSMPRISGGADRVKVTRIEIVSEASGPGHEEPYRAAMVVLQRADSGFRRTGILQTGTEKVVMMPDLVPDAVVEHLAELLEQRAQTDLSLEQFGAKVPREVLVPKLAKAMRRELGSRDLAYIDTMFHTPGTLTRSLRMSFLQLHQDLNPRIWVKASLSDGRSLVISSRSHQPLMLPWSMPRGVSWNTDIPDVVHALVPAQDPNVGLLDVPGTKKVGADMLAASLSSPLTTHETEQAMPGVVQALRARFDLIAAHPDPRPGDPASDTQPVAATIRLVDGPANLLAVLTLRAKNGHLVDELKLDTFRSQMMLAAASPLISTQADEDKGDLFIMELPQPSAAELFEEFQGVPRLASLTTGNSIALSAIALQFYADQLWLILPDHRTVSFPNTDAPRPIAASEVHLFTADGHPVQRPTSATSH